MSHLGNALPAALILLASACSGSGDGPATTCGDGQVTAPETCDRGAVADPGCVACRIVPGFSCAPGAPCVQSVCGDGLLQAGEACDHGPLNGLLLGDGGGCTKTCAREPTCRDGAGRNQACTTACGDGNLDGGEACDDGNGFDGDGCSAACAVEPGFSCAASAHQDSAPCSDGTCLSLPVTLRDFKSTIYAGRGGHPDFRVPFSSYLTPSGSTTGHQITCVPNGAGAARAAWGGSLDSTSRCTGLAQGQLLDGRPVFNAARPGGSQCSCQYTDVNQGEPHLPGYNFPLANGVVNTAEVQGTIDYSGASGKQRFYGQVQAVQGAASFAQWFTDVACTTPPTTPCNRRVASSLSLVETAAGSGQYSFSSGANLIDDGFFPLDSSGPTDAGWGEALACNLQPYWYANASTSFSGCVGPQYLYAPYPGAPAGTAANPPGAGRWFENASQITGRLHDALFTAELRFLFTYDGPATLEVYGDDDTFVFVNGTLALDLGGTHQPLPGRLDLADPDGATPGFGRVQEAGLPDLATGAVTAAERTASLDFSLQKGRVYEVAIFHADRQQAESTFQLRLAGFHAVRSACVRN